MSTDRLKADVSDWVLNWVSQHNETLGKVPCPFARNAIVSNKIDWAIVPDSSSLESLLRLTGMNGLSNELMIIGMDRASIDPINLSSLIKYVNTSVLMPNNIVALEDHPDDVEVVNGTKMNQGSWVLVLIQHLDKLNQASKILEKQGYYENWSQEEYDDVVSWRYIESNK